MNRILIVSLLITSTFTCYNQHTKLSGEQMTEIVTAAFKAMFPSSYEDCVASFDDMDRQGQQLVFDIMLNFSQQIQQLSQTNQAWNEIKMLHQQTKAIYRDVKLCKMLNRNCSDLEKSAHELLNLKEQMYKEEQKAIAEFRDNQLKNKE